MARDLDQPKLGKESVDAAEFVVADDGRVYLGSREALRSRRLGEFDNLVLIATRSGPTLAGVSLISLLLAACNGGGGEHGGGGGSVSSGGSVSGVVADGYLSGMKVYRAGSPSTFVLTDAQGHFSGLTGTGAIVAEPGANGATDISTGLAFLAKLTAPEAATVINPITTIIQAAGGNAAAVAAALGIPGNLNLLTYDPIASSNVAVQTISAQIANTLATASKNGASADAVAAAIGAKIVAGQPVALTSETFLQGVGVPASVAGAIATANAITPDTIAGIAEVEKIVQALSSADAAKVTTALADLAVVAHTVDHFAPSAPTITRIGGADSTVSSISGDNLVEGKTEAGATVTIKAGTSVLGTVKADASGAFSYALTSDNLVALGQGTGKVIVATATDLAENVSSAATSSAFTIDTVAPSSFANITLGLSAATDTGVSHTDAVTNVSAPKITIDLSKIALSVDDVIEVVESGSRIGFQKVTGLESPSDLANFEIAVGTLSQGQHSLSVRVVDKAGNIGAVSAARIVVVDLSAPTIAVGSITGQVVHLTAGDFINPATQSKDLTISGPTVGLISGGNLETGARIDVFFNGSNNPISATINSDGTWSAVVSQDIVKGLDPNGATVPVSIQAIDAAGNVGSASTTLTTTTSAGGADGYISGATFFLDLNNNAQLDSGEAVVTGDAVGSFSLPLVAPIVMKGGVDISTGLQFKAIYEAPTGYKIINPITTLVHELELLDKSLKTAEGKVTALGLFGSAPSADLATFNPFKIATTNASAADFTRAVAYQKAAA